MKNDGSQLKTCAITGAGGFVGGRLTAHLQRRGWRIIEWTRQPAPGSDGVPFQLGQTVDPRSLTGVGALVHCAYDFAPSRWKDIETINITGSERLFNAARAAGVAKIVCISSLSAFAGCRSLYGKAKLRIEDLAENLGAFVIRPGLVYGDIPGGMFGRLVGQARSSRFVPLLSGCAQTQYLIHDEDLAELVCRCLNGQVSPAAGPIAAAHPQAWQLREILARIAQALGSRISFVRVPWRLVWTALKMLETIGLPARFRSDSLIGMVYQDPNPSFAVLASLGVQCRPFALTPGMLERRKTSLEQGAAPNVPTASH
jgi:nucleoside-diphosphate-sugar epimerase